MSGCLASAGDGSQSALPDTSAVDAVDAHLSRFYFRQRVTSGWRAIERRSHSRATLSESRHPAVHYHCPFIAPSAAVCQRYGCKLSADSLQSAAAIARTRHRLAQFAPVTDIGEDDSFTDESAPPTSADRGGSGSELSCSESATTSDEAASRSSGELQPRSGTITAPSHVQSAGGSQLVVIYSDVAHLQPAGETSVSHDHRSSLVPTKMLVIAALADDARTVARGGERSARRVIALSRQPNAHACRPRSQPFAQRIAMGRQLDFDCLPSGSQRLRSFAC